MNAVKISPVEINPAVDRSTGDGPSSPGFIAISFVNHGDAVATEVRFVFENLHEADAVIDDGGQASGPSR